jgi:hypothetical protein
VYSSVFRNRPREAQCATTPVAGFRVLASSGSGGH